MIISTYRKYLRVYLIMLRYLCIKLKSDVEVGLFYLFLIYININLVSLLMFC